MANPRMSLVLSCMDQRKATTDKEWQRTVDHILDTGVTVFDLVPLLYLKILVRQGLTSPQTPFGRWLTQGLYDPRLLFLIRDFLF